MRLIPRESARRRIAWTGRVASSSGNGLNCNEKVAPPSPSGGIEEREMEGGAMGPTGDNDDICDRTSGWNDSVGRQFRNTDELKIFFCRSVRQLRRDVRSSRSNKR